MLRTCLAILPCLGASLVIAQLVVEVLPTDELAVADDTIVDATTAMNEYDVFNTVLGGDSIRSSEGVPCSGWVNDQYPSGALKHRGYYQNGHLIIYKNHHPSGGLEREFKVMNNTRSLLSTFYDNGRLLSETEYVSGDALRYKEYYSNGQLRYQEEKHPDDPYYLLMDLFAEDGTPISTLHVLDKRKAIFEQKEYWPDGKPRSVGRSQFNPRRFDSQRIGDWLYFDATGVEVRRESYVDGKLLMTAEAR